MRGNMERALWAIYDFVIFGYRLISVTVLIALMISSIQMQDTKRFPPPKTFEQGQTSNIHLSMVMLLVVLN